MANTRGKLTAARIIEVDEKGTPKPEDPGNHVDCMFNPYEYTVSKTNTFTEQPKNASNTTQGDFWKSGNQSLVLKLIFDTYEDGTDVSITTNKLWKFMMIDEAKQDQANTKISPPQVAFEWGGVFRFVSYITSMTQKFTLFLNDGSPVRAEVNVTFTQYTDVNDYPKQNPTSGEGASERIRLVVFGDRLDAIAAEEYHDATKWRLIADHNHITNPFVLEAGMQLRIPSE